MDAFIREMAERAAAAAGVSSAEAIARLIGPPKDTRRYTYALPCFLLAKEAKEPPPKVAQRVAEAIAASPLFALAEATGPFVNAQVDPTAYAREVLDAVAAQGEGFGRSDEGGGRAVVIDYSSPNIAKRFHIGHLRSTVIGAALYRIFEALGYRPIGVNHLGDWGTQFGHMLSAWKKWGDEARLAEDPIGFMQELYVRHNQAAKEDPALAEEARAWFKRLEDGDAEARALWKRFLDLSLEDFNRIYELLGVTFDHVQGESFYEDKIADAIARCEAKGITKVSDGALIVDLKAHGYKIDEPLLLRRSDGATLYGTRDVAAGIYRFETFDPAYLLYVIGQEQRLAMRQLFAAMELLGYDAARCKHVWFGRVLGMSSRAGTAVLLDEVLGRAISLARSIVLEKNPEVQGAELDEVSKAVGIGAVVFADLKNGLKKDFQFDWDRIVQFKGETGPYLQYTHARLSSILRKLEAKGVRLDGDADPALLAEDEAQAVLKAIALFPERIARTARDLEPSILAQYLLDLAGTFNVFYKHHKVLHAGDDALRLARARLVEATRQVLASGLRLLGVKPLDRM